MAIAGSHNLNCREDALSFREAFLGWYKFWANSSRPYLICTLLDCWTLEPGHDPVISKFCNNVAFFASLAYFGSYYILHH